MQSKDQILSNIQCVHFVPYSWDYVNIYWIFFVLVRFFCIKLVKEQRIRSAMQCRCVDLFPSQKAPTTKTIRFLGEPGVDLLDCGELFRAYLTQCSVQQKSGLQATTWTKWTSGFTHRYYFSSLDSLYNLWISKHSSLIFLFAKEFIFIFQCLIVNFRYRVGCQRERAWMYNLACESDLTPLSSNVLFGIHFIFWLTWTFNVNQNGHLMRSIPPLCSRDAVMFQCTFLRINFLLFLYGTQLNLMCSLQFIKLTGYLRVRLMSSVLCADCSDTRVLTLTCIPCTYIYIYYAMNW